ncbi:MAG: 6-phosphogluconolactonase, partial [Clostridia bacterium]|nr:6-phosphogluconolactonase [Clostridia bacterium]
MNIIIAENYQDLSEKAAGIVAEEVKRNQQAVLGLATGSTPEGRYAQLVKMFHEKKVDFNSVVTFNLDEYAGLSPEHAQSYHYYMHQHFFKHVNVRDENIHIPCYSDKNIT